MARPKHTRRDVNHLQILRECRELGMVTWDTADLGGRVLDAIVFWRGRGVPVEIKPPDRSKRLTREERAGIEDLARVGMKAIVVTCTDDIVREFEDG